MLRDFLPCPKGTEWSQNLIIAAIYSGMTGLSSIWYLLLCPSLWQTTSSLSEEDFQDPLTPNIFQLDNHGSLHRKVRAASGDLSYYDGDIEISFSDPSLEAEIRQHLGNLDIYTPLLDTTIVTNAALAPLCYLNGSHANCSCSKDYDCLGTLGPCIDTGCICITDLPLQKYCTPKTSMTLSPSTLFQGDTVTIECKFSQLGNISWLWNSEKITESQKYNSSSSWKDTMVLYTLKIKNLTDTDKGNYTCSLNSSGTLQAQSKILGNIKTLQISSSNDMDSFCDGVAINLTCCSPDIGEFNVTWNVSGPAGGARTTTNNATCSIYTITPNFSEFCPTVTNYMCSFQRKEGVTLSKMIKVTYYKKANITLPPTLKISIGKNLNVPCQTDISAKTVWAKNTISNIVTDNNILQKIGVTTSWAGTYFCVVYQGSLSTYANLTVTVIPLPAKEEITVYPLQTYLMACGSTALVKLTCCVNGAGYTRNFTNGTPPITDTNPNCSSTNVTFNCNTKTPVSVICMVLNSLNDWIPSDAMTIIYVQGTTGQEQNCKAQDGRPETPSGKTFAVPCQTFDNTMLGTKTFICNNGRWSELQNDCYSAKIFQVLQNVQDVVNGLQVQQSLPKLLENVTIIATSEKETILNSSKTLELMVEIISTVANTSVPVDESMMQNFIKTVDIVVDKPSAWDKVADQSVIILNSVESFAKNLDFNNTISLKNESKNTNVQLFGQTLGKDTDYNVVFSLQNLTGNVFIENNIWSDNTSTVITIAYGTMKDILPVDTKAAVNGLVMSTIVRNTSELDNNTFTINMSFTASNKSLVKPECVWYDLVQKVWTGSGCTTTDRNGTIMCSCNHLTSFSVLMAPVKSEFLDIITYVGVGISLACLVITLLIEALVWDSVIKNKTSYIRHVCLVNIAVTLLVADIWFMIGAALEKNTGSAACKTAAFFSFFFYLSLFFWMLTTGLILFYRLIYILHDMSRKTMMIIAFVLGYGCPLLICTVTVASTEPSNRFISENFCWLDYENLKPFLAFVVPVLTIVFINFLILIVVIFKLMRPTIGETAGRKDRKTFIVITKTLAVLTPLLGTTWVLGLVIVRDPTNIVIHAIFSALNSFQGLFILISTVLLDQKVRKAVRSSISSSYWRTLRSRVQATSTDSSGTSGTRSYSRKKPFRFGKKAGHSVFTAQDSGETSRSSYLVHA